MINASTLKNTKIEQINYIYIYIITIKIIAVDPIRDIFIKKKFKFFFFFLKICLI